MHGSSEYFAEQSSTHGKLSGSRMQSQQSPLQRRGSSNILAGGGNSFPSRWGARPPVAPSHAYYLEPMNKPSLPPLPLQDQRQLARSTTPPPFVRQPSPFIVNRMRSVPPFDYPPPMADAQRGWGYHGARGHQEAHEFACGLGGNAIGQANRSLSNSRSSSGNAANAQAQLLDSALVSSSLLPFPPEKVLLLYPPEYRLQLVRYYQALRVRYPDLYRHYVDYYEKYYKPLLYPTASPRSVRPTLQPSPYDPTRSTSNLVSVPRRQSSFRRDSAALRIEQRRSSGQGGSSNALNVLRQP